MTTGLGAPRTSGVACSPSRTDVRRVPPDSQRTFAGAGGPDAYKQKLCRCRRVRASTHQQ